MRYGLVITFVLLSVFYLNYLSVASQNNLGKSRAELNELSGQKQQRAWIEREIVFWQQQVGSKNDFRDGYLQLALLNFRINRNFDGEKFLEKARELDPNFKEAVKITGLLGVDNGALKSN